MRNKKVLMLRYGGMGDSIILTPVAKELQKRGCVVDFGVAHGLVPIDYVKVFDNLPIFNRVLPLRRHGNHEFVQYEENGKWYSVDAVRSSYDIVLDYKWSVEENSKYAHLGGLYGSWISQQNSNYQNWVDLSLGWANIDPTEVSDEDKRPMYHMGESELDWAEKVLQPYSDKPIVAVHMEASSLPRTWYYDRPFCDYLLDKMSDCVILHWGADRNWYIYSSGQNYQRINLPEHKLRHSIALLSFVEVAVCTDSAISHFCEAIGTEAITMYTTVPAWTRAKYYKHIHPLTPSSDLTCYPCHIINRWCPEREKEALSTLNDREKEIKEISDAQNMTVQQVALKFNQTEQGIVAELGAIHQRLRAMSEMRPKCVEQITDEMLLNEIRSVLTEKYEPTIEDEDEMCNNSTNKV